MTCRYLSVFLVLLIGSIYMTGCSSPNKNQLSIDELNVLFKTKSRIHTSLPEFTFRIYGFKKEPLNSANKIVISKKDEKERLVQEIKFDKTETPDDESFGFVIEDMNFDGYSDIRIQQDIPAAPNIPFYYWLWDVDSSQFVPNTDLEMITSPEFDFEKKIITSFGRASAVEHFWEVYKYIDGIPTLIKETYEVIDPDNEVVHTTVTELVNNEMKLTEKYDEPWKE